MYFGRKMKLRKALQQIRSFHMAFEVRWIWIHKRRNPVDNHSKVSTFGDGRAEKDTFGLMAISEYCDY